MLVIEGFMGSFGELFIMGFEGFFVGFWILWLSFKDFEECPYRKRWAIDAKVRKNWFSVGAGFLGLMSRLGYLPVW